MLQRLILILIAFLSATVSTAQVVRGYINAHESITSFDSASGELLDTFPVSQTLGTPAVALNDITLYVPTLVGNTPGLATVIGLTGMLFYAMPLDSTPTKVALTSQGGTLFMATREAHGPRVLAINLLTRRVSAAIFMSSNLHIDDIVLSPDDSTLYVSVTCSGYECSKPAGGACPVLKGICAFDVRTLALKETLDTRHGLLSISQDSKSLYVFDQGTYPWQLFLVDAATLQVIEPMTFPAAVPSGPPVVSPIGHFAIVLTSHNAWRNPTAHVLDTSSNQLVSTLFQDAPYGYYAGSAAFTPDGVSFWMTVNCGADPVCIFPRETFMALAGFTFPSGRVINAVPIPLDSTVALPRSIRNNEDHPIPTPHP